MSNMNAWKAAIICYFGPMYSGKTNMAITILYAVLRGMRDGLPIKVVVVRPELDNRDDPKYLTTHTDKKMEHFEALTFDEKEPWLIMKDRRVQEANVVVIDEAQFFDPALARVIQTMFKAGKRVYALGLDMDHLGRPFPAFKAISHTLINIPIDQREMNMMTAICDHCGGQATHSRRLIGGQQAPADSGRFAVEGSQKAGEEVTYRAHCRAYFCQCLAEAGIDAPWLDKNHS